MKQTDLTAYNKYIRKKWIVLLVMVGLLFASAIVSLSAGSANLSVLEILRTVFGGGNRQENAIIWNVRMPRVATATVVGMALALSGCVMQNVLRNPLASASTLGVSQGASFGAAVAIVYFGAGIQVNAGGTASALTVTNPAMVTLCAFLGGIATTAVILGLARFRGSSPATMILAGVAISSMFTGGTALVQYFCDDVMVATVVYWTFGSLGRAGWTEIAIIAALTFGAFVFFYYNRWNYNAMEGGTHTAKSLGVPVDRLIVLSMALCALISSVAVAFVGCISFIGLIAAHIMRRFVGNDYRFLIPCSALCGGVLLLLSDIVSRMLLSPTVLPIGALTSFLGAPLFLYLIVKGGKRK
jgi:iron complex transport system permease protein